MKGAIHGNDMEDSSLLKLNTILLESCYQALKKQGENGEMPAGHNGSYHDEETPLRNTAHWIVSFAKAYEISKDEKFYNAISQGLKLIKDAKWRPNSSTFFCRNKDSKDKCNGLIGQAWVIEGLIRGYEIVGDNEALELSVEVFKKLPFDNNKGIWRRVEPDGTDLGFDFTFNHQLWFAMSGFLILKHKDESEIKKTCNSFMEKIPSNLKLYSNGRIGQSMKISFIEDVVKATAKKLIRRQEVRYMRLKEIGYHAFNTHAFAKIKSTFPDLDFFKTKMYKKIVSYLGSQEYLRGILVSNYGFPYNPPGFEVFFTYKQNKELLNKEVESVQSLLKIQIENHLDKESMTFSLKVHDPKTSAARIYELSESL